MVAAVAVAVSLVIRLALDPYLGDESPLLAFVVAIAAAGLFGGLGAGLFATGLSALLGDFFFVVTPVCFTMSGSVGKAIETRFCTSTWAMSRLVPNSNVTVRLYAPSFVHCDDMYMIPSTPFTCCSIGAATESATSRALAPG